jgi:hypothetical protein
MLSKKKVHKIWKDALTGTGYGVGNGCDHIGGNGTVGAGVDYDGE